ncbi:hypothetical protein LEP1GSC037_1921 [Leptospira interrogans str. 2006001854]|uniref:Uncharacterized protein n=1 Tax=Leptospira interrogans str. 2006001854 TaxID=1001590 RepID=M6GIR4_LEPIR|nr:hypothetical protein LEP1GSC037_1921 [Leptospira interrogans str. 2006001854]
MQAKKNRKRYPICKKHFENPVATLLPEIKKILAEGVS